MIPRSASIPIVATCCLTIIVLTAVFSMAGQSEFSHSVWIRAFEGEPIPAVTKAYEKFTGNRWFNSFSWFLPLPLLIWGIVILRRTQCSLAHVTWYVCASFTMGFLWVLWTLLAYYSSYACLYHLLSVR